MQVANLHAEAEAGMHIRTRLFLGTAGLVLALMAVQWWLHVRQVQAIERTLGAVATSVGRGLLENRFVVRKELAANGAVWLEAHADGALPPHVVTTPGTGKIEVMVVEDRRVTADGGPPSPVQEQISERPAAREPGGTAAHEQPSADRREVQDHVVFFSATGLPVECPPAAPGDRQQTGGPPATSDGTPTELRRIELQVVAEKGVQDRFLVLRSDGGEVERIQIPTAPTFQVFRNTLRNELAVGAALLLIGMVSSGFLAHRLVRPLSRLAEHSEALGRGDLGVQVEEDAGGEVGDLQRAFNRMSSRLAELEREREQWRRREHLAELGDVSRGLAHTVRNPLNTLGLAVEELAAGQPEGEELVATARTQIRRIDGWLRSFLALGAGDAAGRCHQDLVDLVHEAVIAVAPHGGGIQVADVPDRLPVEVVPSAIRAALANLLENAVQASPADVPVTVTTLASHDWAEIRIDDRGPGMPREVRERLFEPHVTTRAGGSGMGLFLARQLIVALHGGELEMSDGADGGTTAVVRLPLARSDGTAV